MTAEELAVWKHFRDGQIVALKGGLWRVLGRDPTQNALVLQLVSKVPAATKIQRDATPPAKDV